MKYKKICKNPNCGKEFMGARTQQYCCPECRVPTGNKKQTKRKQKSNCTLNDIATQARERGVSYGKYVAMQYIEEQRERKNKNA